MPYFPFSPHKSSILEISRKCPHYKSDLNFMVSTLFVLPMVNLLQANKFSRYVVYIWLFTYNTQLSGVNTQNVNIFVIYFKLLSHLRCFPASLARAGINVSESSPNCGLPSGRFGFLLAVCCFQHLQIPGFALSLSHYLLAGITNIIFF